LNAPEFATTCNGGKQSPPEAKRLQPTMIVAIKWMHGLELRGMAETIETQERS
jgi:hypothetical protein